MSLLHNWKVLKQALKADREQRKSRLHLSDVDFLPAALEVIEKPVSPTGRITAWVLMAGLGATILWVSIGKVDVVISASGKIVPAGNVKLVQSAGSGVVRTIYVYDGDVVHKGQALLDLDPTLSGADLAQARKALLAAEIDVARNQAIADALLGHGLNFRAPPGTEPRVAETQRHLIAAQLAEVNANAQGYGSARNSALAESAAASAQIAKLKETLPILDSEVDNMKRLDAKGFAPGLKLLELQRQRRQEVGDADVAIAQQSRGLADASKFTHQIEESRNLARRQTFADLAKAQAEMTVRREEVTKANQKRHFQRITAPEDGTVQQSSVHTVGGVVEPARALMVIVPSADGLDIDIRILNKDVGFVHVGQPVALKLEAFPFTRYGTVPGTILNVSRDAVADPKLGSVYYAKIKLLAHTIEVNGRSQPLAAGLNVTADIRTGSRSILSYMISPLQTTVAQAGRER